MITCQTTLFLLLLVNTGSPQILSSSALNCDFGSTACAWRNGSTGQEDTADFAPGQNLHMDDFHQITSMRPDKDDMFIYSFAFGGRQTALLISDVISCQLGGASLKYWYWKTGNDVTLDICIRQPPGNREPANLRCYDGLSTTHGQQWIFRSVELPPISQPFELMFRTTFTAPLDILALDDIEYEAILCDVRHHGQSIDNETTTNVGGADDIIQVQSINNVTTTANVGGAHGVVQEIDNSEWAVGGALNSPVENADMDTANDNPSTVIIIEDQPTIRPKRGSPPTIGLRDWEKLKKAAHFKGQTMIVVAEEVPDATGNDLALMSNPIQVMTTSSTTTTTTTMTTTTTPLDETSTSVEATTEFITTEASTQPTGSLFTESDISTTALPEVETTTFNQQQHMANIMALLRGVAPVLPYVPTLVQTLRSMDPRVAAATGTDPVDGISALSDAVGIDLGDLSSIRRAPTSKPELIYNGATPIVPVNQPLSQRQATSILNNYSNEHSNSLAEIAKKFGLLRDGDSDEEVTTPNVHTPSEERTRGTDGRHNLNAFGLERNAGRLTTATPQFSTIYPPHVKKLSNREQPRQRTSSESPPSVDPLVKSVAEQDGVDLSELTPEELRQLAEIHGKIFRHRQVTTTTTTSSPDIVVFKKPPRPIASPIDSNRNRIRYEPNSRSGASTEVLNTVADSSRSQNGMSDPTDVLQDLARKLSPKQEQLAREKLMSNQGGGNTDMSAVLKNLAKTLPPGAMDDLSMLRDIPNLEELVQGLDFSLIQKRGGFAKLKQQILQRILRRTMGFPVVEPKTAAPPTVPLKISKKLLRKMLMKARRARMH